MAFRFKLDSILHLRQSLEHQDELRLRAANQQVGRVRHLIEQMDTWRRELNAVQARNLSAGISAAELQFEFACETELLRQRANLEEELARQQQLREQQREKLRQARRARETLEAVRDQQIRLYQKNAARTEQRDLDEMFLLRRGYLR